MAHDVFEKIEQFGPLFADHAAEAEEAGRLTDDVAKHLKDSGLVRLLQPADFGGYEADPRDFLAAAMDVGNWCPSAGWVAGVVGVHPWELALQDERVQEEVWGDDPDTWVASPYAPSGTATRVDGGFQVTGHWKFSSGTDLCEWAVLGARLVNDAGDMVGALHIMLPRTDYEIVDDSWNVAGLEGTGSKDIVVTDTFVPDYRTIDILKVLNGQAFEESSRTQPLYKMPWSSLFPCAVTAGVIGIAEGVLNSAVDYQRDRVSAVGVAQATDPHTRATIGEAAAEIRGSRVQLLYNVGELYEAVRAGHDITIEQRVACRRDQVRVAWRAAEAADKVFAICGGNSIRLDNPVQRFWRSMHAGLHHGIVTRGHVYDAAAGTLWGEPLSGPMAMTT